MPSMSHAAISCFLIKAHAHTHAQSVIEVSVKIALASCYPHGQVLAGMCNMQCENIRFRQCLEALRHPNHAICERSGGKDTVAYRLLRWKCLNGIAEVFTRQFHYRGSSSPCFAYLAVLEWKD